RSAPLRDVVLLSCTCPLVILTSSSLFNDTPTTKIYTLSLHDALPIFEARRVAGDGEYASTLGVLAARQALAQAGLEPSDIDLLLFASASRDMVEPATAHIVQAELGSRAHALDLTNACNSFLNGIDTARSFILAGRARRALVVTGETPTRSMRWKLSSLAQARSSLAGYTFGDA